ncbi:hypothetical protein H6G04_04510 [Calothrix membranacea FACHB-236]|nr:hypothetical protein [Calothrix membranacea FACHB-236]
MELQYFRSLQNFWCDRFNLGIYLASTDLATGEDSVAQQLQGLRVATILAANEESFKPSPLPFATSMCFLICLRDNL